MYLPIVKKHLRYDQGYVHRCESYFFRLGYARYLVAVCALFSRSFFGAGGTALLGTVCLVSSLGKARKCFLWKARPLGIARATRPVHPPCIP